MMTITLVIPAFNEEREISECIRSVIDCNDGSIIEVIVVDNASVDDTSAIAARFSQTRVVSEPRRGIGFARQCGLDAASGDLVAFIDADTRVTEEWLAIINQTFEYNADLVALSGPIKYHDGPPWRRHFLFLLNYTVGYFLSVVLGSMIFGGSFVAKRNSLYKMGGFNTNILLYGEDGGIARQLKSCGRVIFDLRFNAYTSSRRFDSGLIKTLAIGTINFMYTYFTGRTFSKREVHVRGNAT